VSSQLHDERQRNRKRKMKTKTLAKLHLLFSELDCDMEIGLACCLAEMFHTSPAVIFSEYEAWQIA
jgi:NADH:ubiquinone oxidoreductase subunit B-like Fe-S oxidoreductase